MGNLDSLLNRQKKAYRELDMVKDGIAELEHLQDYRPLDERERGDLEALYRARWDTEKELERLAIALFDETK